MSQKKKAAGRSKRYAITANLTADENALIVAQCRSAGMTKAEIVRAGLRLGDAPRDRALLQVTGEVMRTCALLRNRHGDEEYFQDMQLLMVLENAVVELIRLATKERTQ